MATARLATSATSTHLVLQNIEENSSIWFNLLQAGESLNNFHMVFKIFSSCQPLALTRLESTKDKVKAT